MTYHDLCRRLEAAGIEEAVEEAAQLIRSFCDVGRHELLWRMNEDFPSPELEAAVRRREAREPLQYILGEWEFMGLPFRLNRDCLCPRADTELLCEIAYPLLAPDAFFCDAGTGSGAIAVSLLRYRSGIRAAGIDLSPGALEMAALNARTHGVADRFTPVLGSILTPEVFLPFAPMDALISNPPYIPTGEIDGLAPEVRQEPRRALDGGADGLDFYRAMTGFARDLLKPDGFLLFEVGAGQAGAVAAMGAEHGFSAEIRRDLGNVERAVLLRPSPNKGR